MFNGEYGLYWNPPQLALMSLCQLYRMAERREDQNRARMRMANGPDGVGVGRNAGRRDREYGADYDDEEDDEDSLSDDGLYLNSLGRVSNGWYVVYSPTLHYDRKKKLLTSLSIIC
jgi:hypothetical protein